MGFQNFLKAKFLVEKQSLKNWGVIFTIVFWTLVVIYSTHLFEEKMIKINKLNNEVKELRAYFVDQRSELMKLRMESNVSKRMEVLGIKPSEVPPKKIKILEEEKEEPWYKKIWR